MKKQRLLNLKKSLTFSLITIGSLLAYEQSYAQTINSATISYVDKLYACPTCNTTTSVASLNCDLMEWKPDNPSIPNRQLFGIVYGGASGWDVTTWGPVTDQATFYMQMRSSTFIINESLPMPNTGLWQQKQNGSPTIVNDPDIAIGDYNHPTLYPNVRQIAVIVYEVNGDIYMEIWGVDLDNNNNFQSMIPTTYSGGSYSGGQIKLNQGTGNAAHPHVDIIANHDQPKLDLDDAVRYVVSWDEYNSTSGVNEVWNADGILLSPAIMTTAVGEGVYADVAGVSNIAYNASTTPYNEDIVYTTFVDGNTGDLVLTERTWGQGSLNYSLTLGTFTASGTISYPRIAAPVYYDYSLSPNSEPSSVVVAMVDSPSKATTVNSYVVYDPTATTKGLVATSVSNYSNNSRFTTNPNNCIMPVVSGTGKYDIDKYKAKSGMPYEEYPVIFYSDYTWDNINNTYDANGYGDLYNSNIDLASYTPVNTDYYEVLAEDYNTTYFMPSNKPVLAASTSNNSNFDLLVTYYDGSELRYKYKDNSSYSFKPTSINSVANSEIAVYPNPVTTELTIGDAAGAQYTVTSIMGSVVATGTISGNSHKISTANYAAGTYILQVMNDGVPSTVKFVKQ